MMDMDGEHSIDTTTAVMCCLCPLQHGGLKPTTDGRFVHLCCSLFAKDAVITDMKLMSPIDVTEVRTSKVNIDSELKGISDRERQRLLTGVTIPDGYNDDDNDDDDEHKACMFCKLHGGSLVACDHGHHTDDSSNSKGKKKEKEGCKHRFHPLCGWFAGVQVTSRISDSSFQGVEKGGSYPSGLHFSFKCLEHSSAGDNKNKKSSKTKSSSLLPATHSSIPAGGSGSGSGTTSGVGDPGAGDIVAMTKEVMEVLSRKSAVKTARALQSQIRNKYRIKIDDLVGAPGRKRRVRPTQKKEKPRTSTSNSNNVIKEMGIDSYDKTCSCCQSPLSLLLTGTPCKTLM